MRLGERRLVGEDRNSGQPLFLQRNGDKCTLVALGGTVCKNFHGAEFAVFFVARGLVPRGIEGEEVMSEAKRPRSLGRSVGALFAGFVVVVILSISTDIALRGAGIFPPLGQVMSDALLGLATIYRSVFAVVGSYVTARLAPDRPMQHALVGGVIGLGLSIVGAALAWNKVATMGPHWYPLALVATALPCAWIGGKLRLMQLGDRVGI